MLKEEMETHLTYNAADNNWHAWSCISKHINEMKKKGWTVISETDSGTELSAPAFSVRFGKAEKTQRKPMSEEQRAAMNERLAKARQARNIQKSI